jgi:predicted RNA-binding protein with RPS1 domain
LKSNRISSRSSSRISSRSRPLESFLNQLFTGLGSHRGPGTKKQNMNQNLVIKPDGPNGSQRSTSGNTQNKGPRDFRKERQAHREEANGLAMKHYKEGQVVEGKILKFFMAGPDHPHLSALVALKQGGTALMLYDEIPGYPRNIMSTVYCKDDVVDVEITSLRPSKNRISVSLRPVLRRKFAKGLERGHIVAATIIDDRPVYGYFVDLGGGLEALLHNDNLERNVYEQDETFKIGDKTEVVILSNENEGKRIGVGRWQLYEFA